MSYGARVRRFLALTSVLLAWSGCGSGPESTTTAYDIASLRPGVDPQIEAREVAIGLERSGFVVGEPSEGDRFVAFAAVHPDGRTAIRVITRRGIGAALDVPFGEREQAISLRVVDGLEELVVARVDPAHVRVCLALLRVESDGRVTQVPLELGRFGADACVEEVADVGADDAPELLTRLRIHTLSRGETPTVVAILTARGGGYSPAPPSAYVTYWAAERGRITEALEEARRDLDVERAYRYGVELAAITRESGGSTSRQLTAFDEALSGLVLDEAQARGVAAARAHIADGWPD